jgi:hypothetical protein
VERYGNRSTETLLIFWEKLFLALMLTPFFPDMYGAIKVARIGHTFGLYGRSEIANVAQLDRCTILQGKTDFLL